MTNSLNMLLGGLPIAPTPVTPPLNLLLKELYRRPRNRSEWQARFRYWQRPASKTEEAKIEATARRVAAALRHSAFLPQREGGEKKGVTTTTRMCASTATWIWASA